MRLQLSAKGGMPRPINGVVNGLMSKEGGNPYTAQKSELGTVQDLSTAKDFVLARLNTNQTTCENTPVGLVWPEAKSHFLYGYGYGTNYNPSDSTSTSYIFSSSVPTIRFLV
jgi:hypothetical protein